MKNYHTHTYRCKHANGTERDYIEKAIQEGFSVLGFSDHAPWHYESGYHPTMRMEETEIEDYISTLRSLKEEYKDRIEIKIGFEAEYFEDKMEWMKEIIKKYDIDYMILGNHFDGSDETGIYYGMPPISNEAMHRYVDQVIKGMETGLYSYVAHPDVIYYDEDNSYHVEELKRLCIRAKELDIPLEFNLLGYNAKRHYPSNTFLELVRIIGNKMIIGVDAHEARMIDGEKMKYITSALRKEQIEVVDEIRYLR